MTTVGRGGFSALYLEGTYIMPSSEYPSDAVAEIEQALDILRAVMEEL